MSLKNSKNELLQDLPSNDQTKSESSFWLLIKEALWDPLNLSNEIRTPGMSSLLSLGCLVIATRMTFLYGTSYPFLSMINNIVWLWLSTIKFIGPTTFRKSEINALNFLFTNALENVSNVLLVMLFLMSYGITDPTYAWILSHSILTKSIIRTLDQCSGTIKNAAKDNEFEVSDDDKTFFTRCLRFYNKLSILYHLVTKNKIDKLIYITGTLPIGYICLLTREYLTHFIGNFSLLGLIVPLFYLYYFYQVFWLSVGVVKRRSRNLLLFFCIKIVNSYFAGTYSLTDLCCELLGYSVLMTELYLRSLTQEANKCSDELPEEALSFQSLFRLNRNATKELDPMFILFGLVGLISRILGVMVFAAYYYIPLFYEIMKFCHLPLLEPLKTCYVNGVFDLGHYNHMTLFKSAKKSTGAHRLIVGVMSDEDVKKYKGASRPIDPIDERVKFVQSFPTVTEVIKDAPWADVPLDLIEKYSIDCVAHSTEYSESAEDYAYRTPRNMGIVTLIPRGEGASTSKRIDAILKAGS